MNKPNKPTAFISCSLNDMDLPFVSMITKIAEKMGFTPMGTIGKYTAAPMPIWLQMKEGIKNADCVILVATPRYIQQDLFDREKTGHGISEMLHVELGMAIASNCPVLVFVKKGTDLGSFIPSFVQYIELEENKTQDLENKAPLIANYFRSALTIIQEKWSKEKKSGIWEIIKTVLVVIGSATFLSSIFDNDEDNYY